MQSAIRSLRADNERLVVANGASTEYVATLGAIVRAPAKLLVLAKTGVAQTRNAGLREANGTFVLFLDDDGLLIDGVVDILRRGLEAHPAWSGVAAESFASITPATFWAIHTPLAEHSARQFAGSAIAPPHRPPFCCVPMLCGDTVDLNRIWHPTRISICGCAWQPMGL